jgi:hypothetical protein
MKQSSVICLVCCIYAPSLFEKGIEKLEHLAPGVESFTQRLTQKPMCGDGNIQVVRIEPHKVEWVALTASGHNEKSMTTEQWAKKHKLLAAINAGMFATDHRTHVGYFKTGKHINAKKWTHNYKSYFVADALNPKNVAAAIWDLEPSTSAHWAEHYNIVIQNLRLVKGPGKNVWQANKQHWGEAALAMDKKGRILFILSNTPYTMREFNLKLLASNLNIVRAMHLEGGPEASLTIRHKDTLRNFQACFETGFSDQCQCRNLWPIPNIIGIRPKAKADVSNK